MTTVLVDSSVALKWLHEAGEAEVAPSRALLEAHRRGELTAVLLDLAIYELGNILLRRLRWAAAVADQLTDLLTICGPLLPWQEEWLAPAAGHAERHGLSFYDACWATAAESFGVGLVSADRQLLAAGLAESPTAAAGRLGLV